MPKEKKKKTEQCVQYVTFSINYARAVIIRYEGGCLLCFIMRSAGLIGYASMLLPLISPDYQIAGGYFQG